MAGLQPLVIDQGLIQAVGGQRAEIKKLNFGPLVTIDVTSSTVTITGSLHFLNNPGSQTQNIDNILGGVEGDFIILGGNGVRLRTNGNLQVSNNFNLQIGSSITMLFTNSAWYELSRT